MGISNYRLIQSGVVKWEDVVTPARVRDLRVIVSLKRISLDKMLKAGTRPQDAEQACQSVHTPEHEHAERRRRELLERLSKAELSHYVTGLILLCPD